MNLAPVLRQRFFDASGLPLVGGLLYSYAAGTTTPLTTYSNGTGTTNANPVVLDSNGYADVWLDPTLAYKLVLKDSGGSTLWTVDNVTFAVGISAWNANAIYQQGQLVTDSSGAGLMYVSLTNNNQNQALTNVSAWRMFQGNIRTVSATASLVVTDEIVRSNSTSGSVTLTLPTAATTPVGKRIVVRDVGTGGNTTTVGGLTLSNSTAAIFYNTGSAWEVISQPVGAGSITASMLASASVTGAKLDTTAADASTLEVAAGSMRIKDGGVTAAKVASSINLPGNAVQENGRNVVVSGGNASTSLAILRGYINASGTILVGEGFTVNHYATGGFRITPTNAFASAPVVVASMNAIASGYSTAIINIQNVTASTFEIIPFDGGSGIDHEFSFIAIGPR